MPPTASGIADYNAALLPSLAARAEVDVFTGTTRPGSLARTPVRWFATKALGRTLSPWSYDAVVYTVGNSDDHFDTYQLAEEFPGVLWLHDARLPGLYITYARERIPPEEGVDFLRARLHHQYRRRLGADVDLSPAAAPPAYGDAGLGMTEELTARARAVVVSSPLGERLLRLDLGPDARVPPAAVVPIAAPPVVAAPGARAGADAPVLVSLGIVGPAKAPDVAIGALARLRRTRPGARLVFAGFVPDDYRAEVERLVDVAGVADAVEITGHLPREAYETYLSSATCAVLLRRWTNGESSAALTDALAWGLPVVTNVASAADLPAGVVSLVSPSAGPAELAEHLESVLDDPGALPSLAERGRAYAASWGYPEVADRLVHLIATLPT
jgi:glycosyltransferase involved in cell wall biosynthesis